MNLKESRAIDEGKDSVEGMSGTLWRLLPDQTNGTNAKQIVDASPHAARTALF